MSYENWTKIESHRLHIMEGSAAVFLIEIEVDPGDREFPVLVSIKNLMSNRQIVENRGFECNGSVEATFEVARAWAMGWSEGEQYRRHLEKAKRETIEAEEEADKKEADCEAEEERRRNLGYED